VREKSCEAFGNTEGPYAKMSDGEIPQKSNATKLELCFSHFELLWNKWHSNWGINSNRFLCQRKSKSKYGLFCQKKHLMIRQSILNQTTKYSL
jgi:hypothetical protein